MRTRLHALAAAGVVALCPDVAPAQTSSDAEPWKNIRFGATLEAYYQYNANKPPDRITLLRAYDTRANMFGHPAGNARRRELRRRSTPAGASARAIDLQFGQATETVQGGAANEPRPDVYRHVWQAYGTYVFPVGRGLQTDFGKFASNLGYETNYAKDNNHFSRAYLFNFLPFYHSGLRLTLPVSDQVTVMYMLTNGIQQTEDFNDFKSNHVAAVIKPTSAWRGRSTTTSARSSPMAASPTAPTASSACSTPTSPGRPRRRLGFGLDVNYVTNEVDTDRRRARRCKARRLCALQVVGARRRWRSATSASTTKGCSVASIRCCRS